MADKFVLSLPVYWIIYGYYREKLHAYCLWELKG